MAVYLLFVIAGLAATVWGLTSGGRSWLVGAVAALVACGAGLGALHAWGEARSVPWTAGYLGVAALAAVSCARQFATRKPPEP